MAQVPAPDEKTENRPFVRWWWLGSAVDEEGLTWNLEEFAKAGIGGVEITPIYGVQNNESNDVEYLSSRWMELYSYTVKEADRLGLQVDLNNGTGWPFGGPQITPDHSAKKFITAKITAAAGQKNQVSLALKDRRQKENAVVHKVIAVGKSDRYDVTANVIGSQLTEDGLYKAKDATLNWTPDEDVTLYILYSGHTYQKVKRAAPGGEGLVMNHYDNDALDHYLGRFEDAFSASGAPWPDTFFNDSFEVYGSDWATALPDEFYKDHGYRLEMYLPEFMGEGDADTHARIVTDYRQTLARLLEENFTIPWTEWAHSHGVRTRNQAHGSPANIIDLYAAVDIPECESFGRSEFDIPGLRKDPILKPNDGDPAVLKFASSASHLTGKKYTSAEALTWLTEHFRTSLSLCKPEVDLMFASGVNHLYFHGAPYSPKDAGFPGWKFYAAVNISPTNNLWTHAPAFFNYVTRCQAFLTEGAPDNDVLLYLPIHDIWHEQQERQFLIFDIHKMDKTMPRVKEAMNSIVNEGYDADYISDRFIKTLKVRNGRLVTEGGAEYKALVVPACRMMPVETLENIVRLTGKGARIIFIDGLPSDVPGFGNLDSRRTQMNVLLNKLVNKVVVGNDYGELLYDVGAVQESFKSELGGTMLRQRNEYGGYDYFMSMLKNNPIHGYVDLGAKLPKKWNGTVWMSDPLKGEWSVARHRFNGEVLSVYLNLDPGESVLLRIVPQKSNGDEYDVRTLPYQTGAEFVLDKGWRLDFPASDPKIEESFVLDTLSSWTKLDDEGLKLNCGTGRYTINFRTPDVEAEWWALDLGDVRESAKVRLNGKDMGVLFSVPFRLYFSPDHLLSNGEMNTLEVEVCNLPSNRIADFERRGVRWRIFKDANIASVTGAKQFSFADWPADPSGLNSKVKLIQIKCK
ncbi:MAG: glycosyl hydrolase family 2 [Bacteroidales bacterium]|nr:glycosyl hydrolase family 2 [Bacteroidales bacterium]